MLFCVNFPRWWVYRHYHIIRNTLPGWFRLLFREVIYVWIENLVSQTFFWKEPKKHLTEALLWQGARWHSSLAKICQNVADNGKKKERTKKTKSRVQIDTARGGPNPMSKRLSLFPPTKQKCRKRIQIKRQEAKEARVSRWIGFGDL